MRPVVIMRSHNDMPCIAETLAMLSRQDCPHDLIVFDNASTDGTLEEVRKHTDRIFHVPAGQYRPGKVLNEGMEATGGEVAVFLNSDCTPAHPEWLSTLLAAIADPSVGAVFGRQDPRPGCHMLYAKDTEETFGSGELQARWRHCFSMAASAIRRSVWEQMKFREDLLCSEDIDWTWRARQRGYVIRYVPEAVAFHSHNYRLPELYRRQFKEGHDEALIFEWTPWQRSLLRHSLLPFARRVLRDWAYCLKRGSLSSAALSPVLRGVQMAGRRAGFRTGRGSMARGDRSRDGGGGG